MTKYQNFQTIDGEQLQVVGNGLQIVQLSELKKQMRIEDDEEDDLIIAYGCAAESTLLRELRRTIPELCVIGYEDQYGVGNYELAEPGMEFFPAPLKVAVLMLAAHLYRNREAVSTATQTVTPYGYDVLIKPYVRLV